MSMYVAQQSTTGTATGTSSALVGENLARSAVIVSNTHATQTLDLQLCTSRGTPPTAVVGQGIRIAAGTARTVEFKGAIAVIASGAGSTYGLAEY